MIGESSLDDFVPRVPRNKWPDRAFERLYAFRLLGRFEARLPKGAEQCIDGSKPDEMLAYLLLHQDRAHQREVLAGLLWPEQPTAQSRKNLRHGLWIIKDKILDENNAPNPLLIKQKDWLMVNEAVLWSDVQELKGAFGLVHGIPGEWMTPAQAEAVKKATSLYRGDLLEGWSGDWCVYERERVRVMYLGMLEKLLGFCEATGAHEEGLAYGEWLLQHDRAHERAHRRIMRLSYQAGDRTGALRQYERCRAALRQELGVAPSEATRRLYEHLRADAAEELRVPR